MSSGPSRLAASHGEPSYIWRDGQQRRFRLIRDAAGKRIHGKVLEDGCGVGLYLRRFQEQAEQAVGLEYDHGRAAAAHAHTRDVVQAAGEDLPFPTGAFDLIVSHEVIEHVQDDEKTIREIIRALKPGGRLVLFCPNRWYPFETHGVYWRGSYHFGNIPGVNYLPDPWRDRLAPHVRAYRARELESLFQGLPVSFRRRTVIFGGYDNIIAKYPRLGKALRWLLHRLEHTPLKRLGLSHFWVVEKDMDKPE